MDANSIRPSRFEADTVTARSVVTLLYARECEHSETFDKAYNRAHFNCCVQSENCYLLKMIEQTAVSSFHIGNRDYFALRLTYDRTILLTISETDRCAYRPHDVT